MKKSVLFLQAFLLFINCWSQKPKGTKDIDKIVLSVWAQLCSSTQGGWQLQNKQDTFSLNECAYNIFEKLPVTKRDSAAIKTALVQQEPVFWQKVLTDREAKNIISNNNREQTKAIYSSVAYQFYLSPPIFLSDKRKALVSVKMAYGGQIFLLERQGERWAISKTLCDYYE